MRRARRSRRRLSQSRGHPDPIRLHTHGPPCHRLHRLTDASFVSRLSTRSIHRPRPIRLPPLTSIPPTLMIRLRPCPRSRFPDRCDASRSPPCLDLDPAMGLSTTTQPIAPTDSPRCLHSDPVFLTHPSRCLPLASFMDTSRFTSSLSLTSTHAPQPMDLHTFASTHPCFHLMTFFISSHSTPSPPPIHLDAFTAIWSPRSFHLLRLHRLRSFTSAIRLHPLTLTQSPRPLHLDPSLDPDAVASCRTANGSRSLTPIRLDPFTAMPSL